MQRWSNENRGRLSDATIRTTWRIAMPLGDIGTGCVSLGGRGNLRDWEIMNRPAKGFAPSSLSFNGSPFFALRAKKAGEPSPASSKAR